MSPRALLSSIILGIAAASSACATATVGTGPEPKGDGGANTAKADGGVKKEAGPTSPPDAGGPTLDDSGTTVIDDSTCAGDSTRAQCEQCCLGVHPSGYAVYHQELLACACQSQGACATECATELCAQKPTTTGDACEQCITSALTQGGACYDGVANACQADTDCTALFQTCIPPCETK